MKNLVKSIIRIILIYLVTKQLLYIPQLFSYNNILISMHSIEVKNILFSTYIFSYSFLFIFFIVLWIFSEKIAGYVVGKTEENVKLNPQYLLIVSLSIIGIIFIATSIPAIISTTIVLIQTPKTDFGDRIVLSNSEIQLISQFVRIIIGVLFIKLSQPITKLVNKQIYAKPCNINEIYIKADTQSYTNHAHSPRLVRTVYNRRYR